MVKFKLTPVANAVCPGAPEKKITKTPRKYKDKPKPAACRRLEFPDEFTVLDAMQRRIAASLEQAYEELAEIKKLNGIDDIDIRMAEVNKLIADCKLMLASFGN